MSTLPVVEQILRDANAPMSVREIVEAAGETLPTKSKTPDTVVARDLSMDIKKKGEASLFIRTSPGRYGMREYYAADATDGQKTDGQKTDGQKTDGAATSVVASSLRDERAGTKPAQQPRAERAADGSNESRTA